MVMGTLISGFPWQQATVPSIWNWMGSRKKNLRIFPQDSTHLQEITEFTDSLGFRITRWNGRHNNADGVRLFSILLASLDLLLNDNILLMFFLAAFLQLRSVDDILPGRNECEYSIKFLNILQMSHLHQLNMKAKNIFAALIDDIQSERDRLTRSETANWNFRANQKQIRLTTTKQPA